MASMTMTMPIPLPGNPSSSNLMKSRDMDEQFRNILAQNTTLASTGCTRDFCQAGRAVHSDEPRIGENRSLLNVELEAQEFLRDLHREGFYGGHDAFQRRMVQVLSEIRAGAVEGTIRSDRSRTLVGGNWLQTPQELEFGLRRAWRNSRKCIMRSHCDELELCDLRTVQTSAEMATELISAVQKAFNHGNIRPTVFVFPARTGNCRGPMILNHQILQFAGYEASDGSIVGDPLSVELTKAVIDLGWTPPKVRGRWDILPLVTMAEGDKPYIAELPAEVRKLVEIRHPQYKDEFESLDLKWVRFPALTRLGFDIGGVQYTAAPFIGWFMDAEIGVRNLADTFRYNALPGIVHALDMTKGRLDENVEEFEDLAEYEKLAMLSKAQAELNYAVHWSFLQDKVSMTDSMTASMKWCRYDDDFRQKNGFRLPADPYWLAPPQGSIIPLWHRGGAPNYQPKPMICKHVQDPVKAWRRERSCPDYASKAHQLRKNVVSIPKPEQSPLPAQAAVITRDAPISKIIKELRVSLPVTVQNAVCPQANPSKTIAIYFCSAGTVAQRLATKLHRWIYRLVRDVPTVSLKPHVESLNCLKDLSLTTNHIILLVVSSTGHGEIPANGSAFVTFCGKLLKETSCPTVARRGFRFAIFGNGDSRYSSTFNGAAVKIDHLFRRVGGAPLAGGLWNGDTAINAVPLPAVRSWLGRLESDLTREAAVQEFQKPGIAIIVPKISLASPVTVSIEQIEVPAPVPSYDECHHQLLSTLKDALVISQFPSALKERQRSQLLDLSIDNSDLSKEMCCIQILPLNAPFKVQKVLLALGVTEPTVMKLEINGESIKYLNFLTEFVDLESPFTNLEWFEKIDSTAARGCLTKQTLSKLSVLDVLERLYAQAPSLLFAEADSDHDMRRRICLDMPILRTRTYSLASSHTYNSRLNKSLTTTPATTTTKVQDEDLKIVSIMVKTLPSGRFSSTFLNDHTPLLPANLKYRIVDSICGPQLRKNHLCLAPFVIVATGAGFGPVRALLQWRIATAVAAGRTSPPLKRGVSLFLGLKECDFDLTVDVLNEALALDLIDLLVVVVSNPEKRRVYDEISSHKGLVREKLLKGRGMVFVCTNRAAAVSTKEAVRKALDDDEEMQKLGKRYVEEVF